jgi:eukaryotic-like serine/threonine-protein kinase
MLRANPAKHMRWRQSVAFSTLLRNFYTHHFFHRGYDDERVACCGSFREARFRIRMTSTWQRLQGVVLAGQFLLERYLGESEDTSLFRTSYGPDARPAVLRLIPAGPAAADAQLALWRLAGLFAHPNLLPLYDSGQAEYGGKPVLYAVFECPDETLQTALDQGPLAGSEALEILRAVLAVLNYLHSQGLVHTAIDARHVVAVGNQIKLWSDTIHPPAHSETAAEDVASLGDLLFHVLTGHTVGSSQSPDLSVVPDPFRSIIENTSRKPPQRRWTLSQIAEAVDPRPLPPETSLSPRRSPFLLRALPLWAYGALAVMLAGLGFLFLPKSVPPAVSPGPPPPQYSTPATVAPATVEGSRPPLSQTPELPSSVLPPPAAKPQAPTALLAPSPAEPARREAWRVVAYAYSRYADAQRKAKTVSRRWPGSKAAVFSPNGSIRPPHLVALGGVMTRDQAVRLLKTARGKGLPRDTYIRSYPR